MSMGTNISGAKGYYVDAVKSKNKIAEYIRNPLQEDISSVLLRNFNLFQTL